MRFKIQDLGLKTQDSRTVKKDLKSKEGMEKDSRFKKSLKMIKKSKKV